MSAVPVVEKAVSGSEVEREVLEVLRAFVVDGQTARIDPERPLAELGLDSMASIDLLMEIEQELGVQVPDELMTADTFATGNHLLAVIEKLV